MRSGLLHMCPSGLHESRPWHEAVTRRPVTGLAWSHHPRTVQGPSSPCQSLCWPCRPWQGRCTGSRQKKSFFEKAHIGGPRRASSYSLRTLYFNSSSSRASGFLWITRFFFLLTGVCVPPKDVGGWVFLLHSEMNNLAQWRGSVDNRPVAPEGCTGLSTGPGMRVATRQRHPAWTGWFVYGK